MSKEKNWYLAFWTICALTIATRFYKVKEPDHVCWDETHFGKMGSWYINRTFFFDVHPPLGKMLIGLSGYITGYDGTFAFDKPGDKYENTSYIGMRVFCTAVGASVIPMAFATVDELTNSVKSATFASLLLIFDVGLITLTQYILLDPILLCFMMGAILGTVKVSCCRYKEFGKIWWFWLIFTGAMLGCCMSVKFVGLFVVILVGVTTIKDLWDVLGDLNKPVTHALKHLAARSLCLILWPIILYTGFFYIHLSVLTKSGNGDGFYSSAFQSQLIGNSLHNASMPRLVAYGAAITLKNHRTGGGYLHSHHHLYPENIGARQQQITTYTHKDDNNKWIIKKYNTEDVSGVNIVKSGDLIRLEHIPTRRNLHSHKELAPITKKHFQVTGYGENGTGDANDVWRLVVIDGKEGQEVTAVSSKLRFIHYLQSCALTTSGKQLPKWAYEQQEVSCNPNLRDPNSVWNVEENVFAKLPNVSFEVYAPSFLERFLESHAVMIQGNAGLKPKEGEVTSRPWQWPVNYRGQFFSGSGYKIYLLGNPVIWWGNLIFLVVFLIIAVYNAVRYQRGYIKSFEDPHRKKLVVCLWLFGGWLLHYVPFWGMGRVLYFHHYFPALLFSSMLTGMETRNCSVEYGRHIESRLGRKLNPNALNIHFVHKNYFFLSGIMLDYLSDEISNILPSNISNVIYHTFVAFVLSSILYSFYLFSPLAYGIQGPSANEANSTMYGLKWMESWEF